MSKATHAITMNGRISGELKHPSDSPEEVIQKRLLLLDGIGRYSLSLWRLPEGVPFDRVDQGSWPTEYIQCAGSKDRLTVEIRRLEAGVHQQYVVGAAVTPVAPSGPREVLKWDSFQTSVYENEIFDAGRASIVFVEYFNNGDVPASYSLRPCDPQDTKRIG